MANNVDPDEMAYCEPPHQDLHCFQMYNVSGFVCWVEKVKPDMNDFNLKDHSKL